MKLLRRLAVLFTTLTLLIGGTFATANADQYPWPHNGCTSAPDHIAGADFTHPCNQHDGCYALHWADRGTCDAWFWNDMIKECRKLPFDLVANCGVTAGIYYLAVRTFGDRYYNSNGEQVRISAPMQIG